VGAASAAPPSEEPPLCLRSAIQDRSVLASLVLTFFFGPLGLSYTSRWWVALLWLLFVCVAALLTAFMGLVLLWPITMVWGAVTASKRHSAYRLTVADRGRHS